MEEALEVQELQKSFPKKLINRKVIHQGYSVGRRTKLWESDVMGMLRPADRPGQRAASQSSTWRQEIQREGGENATAWRPEEAIDPGEEQRAARGN